MDVLEKLRSHYMVWGFQKKIDGNIKAIYAVYTAPNCNSIIKCEKVGQVLRIEISFVPGFTDLRGFL